MTRGAVLSVAIRSLLASGCAAAGLFLAWRYPLGPLGGLALLLAGAGLSINTPIWLAAIPVVLVAGDLYPSTGSLLVTEADLILLGALAVLFWPSRRDPAWMPTRGLTWLLWTPVAVSACVSAWNGWHALPASVPGDQLSIYASQWNAIRVFKGYAWGLVLAQLYLAELERNPQRFNVIATGMRASALVVAMVVMIERSVSVGLLNIEELYRATGPFVSMHTGGMQIDAFWAMALPFLFLPPATSRSALSWAARLAMLLAAFYAIGATMSRGVIVWSGLVMLILGVLAGSKRWPSAHRGAASVLVIAAVLLVATGVVLSLASDAVMERFGKVAVDARTRANHWVMLLRDSPADLTTSALGHGLGTGPTVVAAAYDHPARPAELVISPKGRASLRLRPGKSLYVEQIVDRGSPGPWTLSARGTRAGSARAYFHLCEKTLLDSFRCIEGKLRLDDRAPAAKGHTVELGALVAGDSYLLPTPVTLAISVAGRSGYVDISELRLQDAQGRNLLANSDFTAGSTRWFFTSDDLLSWRAENVWVQLYLEQGWLGVVSFAWLIAGTWTPLVRQAGLRRDLTACVLAVAIAGFLAIGMIGTLLDTPCIAGLMLIVLAVAQAQQRPRPE